MTATDPMLISTAAATRANTVKSQFRDVIRSAALHQVSEVYPDVHGRPSVAALRFTRIVLVGGAVTEPRDEIAAGAADGGRLRASDADREQVIDVLKAAFVQARLTKDELDARVGQAFVSRTYAELAAVIADIPAAPTEAQPPCQPVRPEARQPLNPDLKGDLRVLVTACPIAVVSWLAVVLVGDNPAGVLLPLVAFVATVMALHSCLHGAMVLVEPWLQRRFGWQLLPPSPEPGEWLFSAEAGPATLGGRGCLDLRIADPRGLSLYCAGQDHVVAFDFRTGSFAGPVVHLVLGGLHNGQCPARAGSRNHCSC